MLKRLFINSLLLSTIVANFAFAENKLASIQIKSKHVELNEKTGVATYQKDVIATQENKILKADILILTRGKDNKVELITAKGKLASIEIKNPGKKSHFGKAKVIKYYPQTENIELIHDAKLIKDNDLIMGPMISYNFKQEVLTSSSKKDQYTTVIISKRDHNETNSQ